LQQSSSQQLRRYLDDFIHEENIPTENAQFYSHVLPSPELMTLRQRRIAGRNWALAGDAAACVDPITGEGLYYALRSGDLLAQAIADGSPETYPARMRAELSADLEFAARIAQKIFRGTFLGEAVTTRMIQFVRRSATFRALMRDLFSGAQDYRSLKRRLWAQLGITLTEFAKSLVEPQPSGNPTVDREPAQ
ncbi:MAG: NAD(P)/FAD-dependent oxidoreductase, partial [Candidatus Acidiferrales bacterium]